MPPQSFDIKLLAALSILNAVIVSFYNATFSELLCDNEIEAITLL